MNRRIAAVVLCILLIGSVAGANLALGAERGPYDRSHVVGTADDANLPEHAQSAIIAETKPTIEEEGYPSDLLPLEDILADAVTPSFVEATVEQAFDELYESLESGDSLTIHIDVNLLEAHVRDAVLTNIGEIEYAAVDVPEKDRLDRDPATYAETRADIRQTVVSEAGFDADEGYGDPTLAAMRANSTTYAAEQEAILDEFVEGIFEELGAEHGFGNDRLERMRASNASYTDEQDQFRADRKTMIQRQTPEELTDEQLRARYTDSLDDIIDATETELEDAVTIADAPAVVEPHQEAFISLVAEALATNLTHDTFTERYDAKLGALEADIRADVHDNPSDYRDELREGIENEIDAIDAPSAMDEPIDELVELLIDALTTDVPYETFVAEYDAIALSIERAAGEYLWDNRDDYQEAVEPAPFDELPPQVQSPATDLLNLTLEAVLTELSYDDYVDSREQHEEALGHAIVDELFAQDPVPKEVSVGNTDGENESGLLTVARIGAAWSGPLAMALTGASMILVVSLVGFLRDPVPTAAAIGISGILAGATGIVIHRRIQAIVEDRVHELTLVGSLEEATTAFLVGLVDPLGGQSIGLLIVGGVSLVVSGTLWARREFWS